MQTTLLIVLVGLAISVQPYIALEHASLTTPQNSEDTEKLSTILQQAGRLDQMQAWDGKALFVHIDDTQEPPQFQVYSHRARYRDTNRNRKQDGEDEGFFNPASTVKVAIAALVLEQLKQRNVGRDAQYRIAGTSTWRTVADDLKKMLIISDNDAANRLILFLGFQYLNQTLRDRGLQHYTVTRLMLNRGTLIDSLPIELRSQDTLIQIPRRTVTDTFDCYEVGETSGNCASAHNLAGIWLRFMYPIAFPPDEQFDLRPTDRAWMQRVMSQTPQQLGFDYEDTFCRFLDPLGKAIAHQSGRLLSKCGIGLFSYTFTDSSFLETDQGQKYVIVFAVTPPKTVSKAQIIDWLNETSQLILQRLSR